MARRAALAVALALAAPAVHASFLSGEAVDTAANVLAWGVLIFVPFIVLYLFWMVHILPEKIAEKRQHPQKEAIKTLCILSLVFGGMLWPIAWLWAYAKPVGYKLAYGTDKHEDYYKEAGAAALHKDAAELRTEVETLAQRGADPAALDAIRRRLAALEARLPVDSHGGGAPS